MEFKVSPIGFVQSTVTEPVDVDWGSTTSTIVLLDEYKRGAAGLADFSHLLVLTWLNRARFEMERHIVRRPQGREDMPLVGIFSQRAKDRPNPIGVTAVRLLSASEGMITVTGLDAIDKTPVIDIKPYYTQYDQVASPVVPEWVERLMVHYF
jgi:tRNA (adenine37-N6)-methyltransferase